MKWGIVMKNNRRNPSFIQRTLLLCFIAGLAFAQAPDTLWSKLYGGPEDDFGFAVSQTADSGFIIAGGYDSLPYWERAWLLKTNEFGDTLWAKTYVDSLGIMYGYARDVQQTYDGGYILYGGYAYSGLWYIKTDSVGDVIWMTSGSGGPNSDIHPWSIKQTADSGYIATGWYGWSIGGISWEGAYLSKTDALGSFEWGLELAEYSRGYEVQETNDGSYVVAAGCVNGGAYFVKVNPNGSISWAKTYGVGAAARSICLTSDNGYVVLAYKNDGSAWLLETDEVGDTMWTKTYSASSSCSWENLKMSVRQTHDSGYIIGGTVEDGNEYEAMRILKTDSIGNVLWENSYGGTMNEYLGSVELTFDRGYIVVGRTNSFGAGGYDIYLFRLATDTLGVRDDNVNAVTYSKVSSNIISGALHLPEGKKCRVFDVTGRVIEPTKITRGIYFLEIDNEIVRKVVKIR